VKLSALSLHLLSNLTAQSQVLKIMEDPVSEITSVIKGLTETSPTHQQQIVQTYFTPQASFTHPFCRTGTSPYSRYLISRIYLWYKVLSPKIALTVHSTSFDEANNILYVGITQDFRIWAIPFHRAEVSLVTVLHLEYIETFEKDKGTTGKWYISSQNDLYQTDQFVKFVAPHFGPSIVMAWQMFATFVCVICSYLFLPVIWWEERNLKTFKRVDARAINWNDGK